MEKCCVCGKEITKEEPAILFVGLNGDEKEICTVCEQKMDVMTNSDKPKEVKDAINYFYNRSTSVTDKEVMRFLREGICANAVVVEEVGDNETTMNTEKERDYFSEKRITSNEIWIMILKVTAWISFIFTIVGGITLAIKMDTSTSSAIIIGIIIAGCLSLSLIMVIINIAKDVSDIKRNRK